ncbi:MAG: hypothetical protein ACYDC1_02820 [Limisphaerales bacterium]
MTVTAGMVDTLRSGSRQINPGPVPDEPKPAWWAATPGFAGGGASD